MPLRTLIVDDHWLARDAIRTALRFCRSVEPEVVGEASDGATALEMARELRPDVITMDIGLPDMDGLEVARRLQAAMPGTAIVIVTVQKGEAYQQEAAGAGAGVFITKDRLIEDLPGYLDRLASQRFA